MEVLLKQSMRLGFVCIARAPDGRYHVLWGDDSLGSADSLAGALVRASAGPLKRARDGTDVVSLGLSRDASKWMADGAHVPASVQGPAESDSAPPPAPPERPTVD